MIIEMSGIEQEVVAVKTVALQGHKASIFEALANPLTNKQLYETLNIPSSSIRRCLSEMKCAGIVEKRGSLMNGTWRII
jgi:predicted HTH transcriptional regulator